MKTLLLKCRLIPIYAGFLPCLIVCAVAAAGGESGDDWQLAGFSKSSHAVAVFFLATEIKREPMGKVQVWTKVLSLSRLQHVYDARMKDNNFVKRVAKTAAAYYVPSIAQVKSITVEQSLDVIAYEDIANDPDAVTAEMRAMYEIDCPQSLYRTLSILSNTGHSNSVPSNWEPVPPESTIRSLQTLTCTSSSYSD